MKLHKSALEKVVNRETRVCKEPLFSSYKSWGIARKPHVEVLQKATTAGLKDLLRKVAMVLATGTLNIAKEPS